MRWVLGFNAKGSLVLRVAGGAADSTPTHLDGHLGPEAGAQLVNDLSIEAATIVHVTHQHGEGLWGRGQG